jgi:sodium/bile acid cotransporter 3/5
MWALLLGGNINLSITMTTLSTLLAFGTMPLWIFTLGKFVFDRAHLGIPYRKIATFAIGLIIPLLIGVGIQKYFERCAKFLMRILKPLTFGLLIFIIVFAIISNLYLFSLFSWQVGDIRWWFVWIPINRFFF